MHTVSKYIQKGFPRSESKRPLLIEDTNNSEQTPENESSKRINEILIETFQGLNESDQCNCRLVSKKWQAFIDYNTELWAPILKNVLNIRHIPDQIFPKDLFLKVYTNLKTEKFKKCKNEFTKFYKDLLYNRIFNFNNFNQTKMFRVQGGNVFYAMENFLFVERMGSEQQEKFIPHEGGPIKSLEVQGNFIITSGLCKVKEGKSEKYEVKIWDMKDLSLVNSFRTPMLVLATKLIDKNHLICGELFGNTSLWELSENGAKSIGILPRQKNSCGSSRTSIIGTIEPSITFVHYIPTKKGGVIVTRDTSEALYFWTYNNESKTWVPEAIQKSNVKQDRIFHAVGDIIFEAAKYTGKLRINGKAERLLNLKYGEHSITKHAIVWLQFDGGNLYIATTKEMISLDFSTPANKNKLNNKTIFSIEQLKKDLKFTKKRINARQKTDSGF